MSRPDPYMGNYVVNITCQNPYIFMPYQAYVTKGWMNIGWAWAWTENGARKKARKIIKRHKIQHAQPEVSYKYEVAE